MRKQPRTRLRVARDVLRTLQAHELRRVDGGNAVPATILHPCPAPPITGDSVQVCCA
jgi:hypothetical protein